MVGEILFSYSFAAVFPALVLYPYLYFMCVCVCVFNFIRDCLAFPSVEFSSSWNTPTKTINNNQVLTWAVLFPRFFIHWDFSVRRPAIPMTGHAAKMSL